MGLTVYFNLNKPYVKGLSIEIINASKKDSKALRKILNDTEVTINLLVNFYGKLIKTSSGIRIKPIHWDFDGQKIKPTYRGNLELNLFLEELRSKVITEVSLSIRNDPSLNLTKVTKLVKDCIKGRIEKVSERKDFHSAYADFIEEKRLTQKHRTYQKYKTVQTLTNEYQVKNKLQLDFDDLDKDFEIAFKLFLIKSKGMVNNTISKYFECLKVFLKWSFEKKYHQNTSFISFKATREHGDIFYLTAEEVKDIEDLELEEGSRMEKVRDVFLLGVYTSQRYSDLCNLKYSDIQKTEFGLAWHCKQIKGNKTKTIIVPLLSKAIAIIEKYQYRKGVTPYVLDTVSNVRANELLKDIAQLAGLEDEMTIVKYSGKERIEKTYKKWELVTTHCARRTFVTLSLEKNLRPETVMEITGHESYKVMQRYISITDKVKNREFFAAWEGQKNQD